MPRNMGTLDRIIRLILGVLLLGIYGITDSPWRYLAFLGLFPLGTALTGRCPLYAALGINTCRKPAPASQSEASRTRPAGPTAGSGTII